MKIRKFILEKTNYFLSDINIKFFQKVIDHKIAKYFLAFPLVPLIFIRYVSIKEGDFVKVNCGSFITPVVRMGIVSEKYKFLNDTHAKIICMKTNKEEVFNMTYLIEILG